MSNPLQAGQGAQGGLPDNSSAPGAPPAGGMSGMPPGPPYPPQVWSIGGMGVQNIDVPVTAVFLALFIGAAVMHMTIYQLNSRRGHKFLISGLLFGFSMARVVTTIMRIASVEKPTDAPLAIAAAIFLQAGVVILFIVNLLFTQRILRAMHQNSAWHPLFSKFFLALYVLIVLTIAAVIVVAVQSFYTLDANIHRIDRDVQLYATTFFAFVALLPVPMLLIGLAVPASNPLDGFGTGRWHTKLVILLTGSTLIAFGALYRCVTNWEPQVPLMQPMPGYFGKAPFYIAYFAVEVVTLYLYGLLRVDQRFHVPNGAKGPGSYGGRVDHPGKISDLEDEGFERDEKLDPEKGGDKDQDNDSDADKPPGSAGSDTQVDEPAATVPRLTEANRPRPDSMALKYRARELKRNSSSKQKDHQRHESLTLPKFNISDLQFAFAENASDTTVQEGGEGEKATAAAAGEKTGQDDLAELPPGAAAEEEVTGAAGGRQRRGLLGLPALNFGSSDFLAGFRGLGSPRSVRSPLASPTNAVSPV